MADQLTEEPEMFVDAPSDHAAIEVAALRDTCKRIVADLEKHQDPDYEKAIINLDVVDLGFENALRALAKAKHQKAEAWSDRQREAFEYLEPIQDAIWKMREDLEEPITEPGWPHFGTLFKFTLSTKPTLNGKGLVKCATWREYSRVGDAFMPHAEKQIALQKLHRIFLAGAAQPHAEIAGQDPLPLVSVDTRGDHVCQHGVAMDVHCCGCHSGFIFERDHECDPALLVERAKPSTGPGVDDNDQQQFLFHKERVEAEHHG